MTNFISKDITEMTFGIRGNMVCRFEYETNVIVNTDKTLIENFFKCADWIKENFPNITYKFSTIHDAYFKLDLIIENGEATLAYGSHSAGYSMYLSKRGTAFYTQGSCQKEPYLFEGLYGFKNDKLVKFLKEWQLLKNNIISVGLLYSDTFRA